MTQKIIDDFTGQSKQNIKKYTGEDGYDYYSCVIHQSVGNFPEFMCQECVKEFIGLEECEVCKGACRGH